MARVLITRESAEPLARCVRALGHTPVHIPLIELESTGEAPPLGCPGAVLLTSKATVRFVPNISDIIGQARVFAVGSATAAALRGCGIEPEYVGTSGGIVALHTLLAAAPEETVWFIGAREPSPQLERGLKDASAVSWHVYRNDRPDGYESTLECCDVDVITFTSASAVRAYVDVLGPPEGPVVVIGETTAAAARDAGARQVEVARDHTMEELALAVSRVV